MNEQHINPSQKSQETPRANEGVEFEERPGGVRMTLLELINAVHHSYVLDSPTLRAKVTGISVAKILRIEILERP